MIIRILNNKNVVKINVPSSLEDEFIVKNPTGGFKKVDSIPHSDFNCWKLDKKNKIIVDKDREKPLRQASLREKLSKLADDKTQAAKDLIGGKIISSEQVERYESKYQMAVEFLKDNKTNKNKFQLEADLTGISVKDLATKIVTTGKIFKEALNTFNLRIDAFRVNVNKIIDSGLEDKLKQAEFIINKAYQFDANTSDDDIKALFTSDEYKKSDARL